MLEHGMMGGAATLPVYGYDIFGDSSGLALYKFNGNALDESGLYNCTLTGTPTYVAGISGQALVCTTTAGYATAVIPTIKAVSIFVTFDALPINATFHVVYGGANTLLVVRYVSAGVYTITPYMNGTASTYYLYTSGNVSLSIGVPYHFCAYIDGSNRLSLYLNGTALFTDIVTSSNSAAYNGTLIFGLYGLGYDTYRLRGKLDHCRVLNRALTPAEVTILANEI